ADDIARARWPGREEQHGHDAARAAGEERDRLLAARNSFIAETVFSHPSKLDLVMRAGAAGYLVTLHVVLVPEELSVARARLRTEQGGHSVPIAKVRARYRRLWPLVRQAVLLADEAVVYDNSRVAQPFRVVARYRHGQAEQAGEWPAWSPIERPSP
ncbi:MAG: zeta toxin family protein, partial [Nevskiaceae bacterium]